jgi:hypothetical protein
LASVIEQGDPSTLEVGEAFGSQDAIESIPTNRVESLPKIELENSSRGRPFVTRLNNVSSIHKVFSDRTARDEASLIRMDQERNEPPEPQGQTFRVDPETSVLKRDGAKVVRLVCPNFFRKENNMRLVNGS